MIGKNVSANRRRAWRVAHGQCGICGEQRNKLAWLCDGCAEKHRVKQRPACPHCAGVGFFADEDQAIMCHVCGGDGKATAKSANICAKEMGK